MMGKSRIKEMLALVDVANPFLFGVRFFSLFPIPQGGELLFDGGMVLTY